MAISKSAIVMAPIVMAPTVMAPIVECQWPPLLVTTPPLAIDP